MASTGAEVAKDIIEVLEGVGTEVAYDVAVNATATSTTSSSVSVNAKPIIKPSSPNLFFKFGQVLADVAVSLVCCACNKGQQNISAQVEAPVDATQIQSSIKPTAPKPK